MPRSVLTAGCLQADSLVGRSSALRVEAGDLAVKARRKQRHVPLAPFGRVADYVPFYFAPRSPMLLSLASGNVPTYSGGQDPLVYLVSSAEAVAAAGERCLFSDGNCASPLTQFFGDLALLGSVVDWDLMTARMWANTPDDQDRMRRRMAEFLVHQRVPASCVSLIVVRHGGNLDHVLQSLEGHYLRGYGDRTQKILDLSPVMLIDGADGEARQWLKAGADDATARRIADVVTLVTDFASPYGVELLATVHWTATRETPGAAPAAITAAVRAWSPRKERLFTEHHVSVVADRLRALGWLDA